MRINAAQTNSNLMAVPSPNAHMVKNEDVPREDWEESLDFQQIPDPAGTEVELTDGRWTNRRGIRQKGIVAFYRAFRTSLHEHLRKS